MVDDIGTQIKATKSISPATQNQIKAMASDVTELRCQANFLRALDYGGRTLRYNGVSLAHSSTFLWIFDGQVTNEDDEKSSESVETTASRTKSEVQFIEFTSDSPSSGDTRNITNKLFPTPVELVALGQPGIGEAVIFGSDNSWRVDEDYNSIGIVQEFDESSSDGEDFFQSKFENVGGDQSTVNKDNYEEAPTTHGANPTTPGLFPAVHMSEFDSPIIPTIIQHPKKETNFISWLTSGSGLYWITGKPGCGKSTVMKFIVDHAETTNALEEWKSAGNQLVTAGHYFWAASSGLESSEEGLVRSILHQITSLCPRVVEFACPEYFRGTAYIGEKSWAVDELRDILTRVATCSEPVRGHVKFALFIDGLDECNSDHDVMLTNIMALAPLPHVKFCVSSRAWPVFERHFMVNPTDPVTQIMVHEYTYNDIYLYTKDKLDWKKSTVSVFPHGATEAGTNQGGCQKSTRCLSLGQPRLQKPCSRIRQCRFLGHVDATATIPSDRLEALLQEDGGRH